MSGVASPPAGPSAAVENVDALAGMRDRNDTNPAGVHGDRLFFTLGPTYVDENRMDDFYDAALGRASASLAQAAIAVSVVSTLFAEP